MSTKPTETSETIIDTTNGDPLRPAELPIDSGNDKKITSDGVSALDALAKTEADSAPTPVGETETPEEIAAREKSEKDKADADKAAADAAAGQTDEEKAAAKDKAEKDRLAAEEAEKNRPKDKLDEVQLPPHVKPATSESFKKLKDTARAEISALRTELETAKKAVLPAGELPAAVKTELEDLRNFRTAHAVGETPEFKSQYETPITQNNETIISKLKQAGYTDDHITKIKAIGLDKLDWKPVLDSLPPQVAMAVQAKLLDNENILDKRAKALDEAKANPQKFAEAQKLEAQKKSDAENAEITQIVSPVLEKAPWFNKRTIPASATAAEKAQIEDHNKFVDEQVSRHKLISGELTPNIRGQLIASTLIAYANQRDASAWKARAEKAESEIAAIRKSSRPQQQRNGADNRPAPAKPGLLAKGTDALDALAAEVGKA